MARDGESDSGVDGAPPESGPNPASRARRGRPAPGSARHRRCAARFAAVQALYQAEMTGVGLASLIAEYREHRLRPDATATASESLGPADETTFANAVRAAGRHRRRVDAAIRQRLKEGWTSERLDPVLRASLRAAGGELAADTASRKEILRDYTDLARAFGGSEREIGFANAMLEGIACALAEGGAERPG